MEPLQTALKEWRDRPHAPFYTPGHKNGRGFSDSFREAVAIPGKLDFPELPGLDNLFAPNGIIATAQSLAAKTWGADRTWFSTNGSSAGIMAAIVAACQSAKSDDRPKILMPRNVHRSAIAGLIHANATPVWLTPEYDRRHHLAGCVSPATFKAVLERHPDTRAAFIVSPTYHGMGSDIAAIASICHDAGIPLIVDEAHGAHFGFHPLLPPSALQLGADVAIQSTHKTLNAFTQAAMVHVRGDRLDPAKLDRALQIFQSTSPNYLLLASLDSTRAQIDDRGEDLFDAACSLAIHVRQELAKIDGLKLLELDRKMAGFKYLDILRLTIDVTDLNLTGFAADELLCELGVVAELPMQNTLTFIITPGNDDRDINLLIEGCHQLAASKSQRSAIISPNIEPFSFPEISPQTPRAIWYDKTKTVPVAAAIGEICSEAISPYPPGIPVLFPGEVITAEAIDYLQHIIDLGGEIVGTKSPNLETIDIAIL
jgi:arginine decarboxylase